MTTEVRFESGATQGDMEISSLDRSKVNRQSTTDRPATDPVPARQRSRIANGSALLPGVDQRSAWVRRAKEIIAAHTNDLGGEDNTSTAERSIIRRASVMTVELERLEAKFATSGAAGDSDLDLYQRTAGNLRRLLEAVGLQRRPRDISVPTLSEIALEIEAEKQSGT
jgi:hypothetical protein